MGIALVGIYSATRAPSSATAWGRRAAYHPATVAISSSERFAAAWAMIFAALAVVSFLTRAGDELSPDWLTTLTTRY